jgi:hypothetical protein
MPITAPAGMLPAWMPPMPVLIGAGVGLFVLIALVAIVLRKRSKKKNAPLKMSFALPAPVADLERVLEARDVDAPKLAGSESPALPAGKPVRERVLSIVRDDVERTAEVLTAWLSEPPPLAAKGATK